MFVFMFWVTSIVMLLSNHEKKINHEIHEKYILESG